MYEQQKTQQLWTPHAVTFSSGGVRLIGQLGVLAQLREEGLMDSVTEWYGCSGGCIPALIGAIGCSPAWIADMIRHMNIQSALQYDAVSISAFPTTWGITNGAELQQFMCALIDTWQPGCSAWTFSDLTRETGAGVTFIATNVSRRCQAVFNVKNTPTMRIMDAIRASMAIPLVFTPSLIADDYHCDGSVLEYFPWTCIPNKHATLAILNDDYLVPGRQPKPDTTQPASIYAYISQIISTLRQKTRNMAEKPRFWIALNDDTSFLDFNISLERRQALFEEGRTAGSRWLAFRSASKPSVSAETVGTRPSCEDHHISDVARPSQNRKLDSHPARSPQPQLCPVRDLPQLAQRSSRRWSL